MIKVKANVATRQPIPAFLVGLDPVSLLDLSWTDPALGVSDCAWWPEDDQSLALGQHERYGAETLTVDAERQVVVVTRAVVPWSEEEIAAELNTLKAAKLAALAARRWQAETGGITLASMPIKTDEDTQRKITGAYVQAAKNPDMTVRWKMGAGVFMTLDAETIIAIGDAVTAHIQACFDREAEVSADILAAADIGALVAVDIESGWPG